MLSLFRQIKLALTGYANASTGYANASAGYANASSGYANASSGYANASSGYANASAGYANAHSTLLSNSIKHLSAILIMRIADRYSFHFISTPSTQIIPQHSNFTNNFLITICKAGSSFQHSCKKPNPEFAATFSFCIRLGRIFDKSNYRLMRPFFRLWHGYGGTFACFIRFDFYTRNLVFSR
ncbi:hypothetical protein [Nostoc sp.]|uniref:hypothetical protein n=1 Tax=Nostoc sp. TaxID=1180 RepID=UPI002FF44CDC